MSFCCGVVAAKAPSPGTRSSGPGAPTAPTALRPAVLGISILKILARSPPGGITTCSILTLSLVPRQTLITPQAVQHLDKERFCKRKTTVHVEKREKLQGSFSLEMPNPCFVRNRWQFFCGYAWAYIIYIYICCCVDSCHLTLVSSESQIWIWT